MARYNEIVRQADPKGVFKEGTISGTPLPGTCMQVQAGTNPDGSGRLTYEVFNQASDGTAALVAVLREDHLQGKGVDDAYVTGKRGFLYCPAAGEELYMRVSAPGTGTGNAIAVGDRFMIDDGTGLLVADSSGDSVPFIAIEAVDDVESTGTLVLCMYTGH